MSITISKKYLIIFLALFLFINSTSVYAGLVPCGLSKDDPKQPGDQTVPCQLCHFFELFSNVISFITKRLVPIVAALMVAIGGFMYVFAYISLSGGGGGEPALLSQAKRLFASVAIGLLIVYGAWFLVHLFFQLIGVASWTGLKEGWWKINCSVSVTSENQLSTTSQLTERSTSRSSPGNIFSPTINSVNWTQQEARSGEVTSLKIETNIIETIAQPTSFNILDLLAIQKAFFGDIFKKSFETIKEPLNQINKISKKVFDPFKMIFTEEKPIPKQQVPSIITNPLKTLEKKPTQITSIQPKNFVFIIDILNTGNNKKINTHYMNFQLGELFSSNNQFFHWRVLDLPENTKVKAQVQVKDEYGRKYGSYLSNNEMIVNPFKR